MIQKGLSGLAGESDTDQKIQGCNDILVCTFPFSHFSPHILGHLKKNPKIPVGTFLNQIGGKQEPSPKYTPHIDQLRQPSLIR